MYSINVRNVNEAYSTGLKMLSVHGNIESSRNGDVLALPAPMITVYHRPIERVLFDSNRDANPFFHLIEAVWMLGGQNDATLLDRYVKDFSERYAEEDGLMHGAYGYRWRNAFNMDQLFILGDMLFNAPTTRRAVLTMWDPGLDLGTNKRDLPCNTHVYFRGRYDKLDREWFLDMTVCCRSNDAIWGAYGANAVHMSILGEVMAGLAGMRFGTYTQISNNFHAYMDTFGKLLCTWNGVNDPYPTERHGIHATPICHGYLYKTPLDRHKVAMDAAELLHQCRLLFTEDRATISHPWIVGTVIPMMRLHAAYKDNAYSEMNELVNLIHARDWRAAAQEWIDRRVIKKVL